MNRKLFLPTILGTTIISGVFAVRGQMSIGSLLKTTTNTAYANLVTNSFSFDALNRLTNIVSKNASGTTLGSFGYQLGQTGHRTNLSESVNSNSRTFAWAYDKLYRLTNETIGLTAPTGTITNSYDGAGNRLTRVSTVSGIGNQSVRFNSNDRLSSEVYDSNGNVTASGANTYDVLDRMIGFNSSAATYTYDANGFRVKTVAGDTMTIFLVDDRNPTGFAQVLEEKTVFGGTTNLSKAFTYGHDLVSQRQSAGMRHYYGYDGNGNVRYLSTTATPAVVTDTYVYEAFGNQIASSGSISNNYRFAGEYRDTTSSLTFLRTRHLNSATGRFMSMDKFEGNNQNPLSLHKYLYCAADPVNKIDPSGVMRQWRRVRAGIPI